MFGAASWRFETSLAPTNMSVLLNRFAVRAGFMDSSSADSIDGCYLRYVDNNNNGEWEAVCRNNSTETACDTNVSPTAATYQKLFIWVTSDGATANFAIDNQIVCTVTTNIPTGNTRSTGTGITMVKQTQTTSRNLEIDYIKIKADFNQNRY